MERMKSITKSGSVTAERGAGAAPAPSAAPAAIRTPAATVPAIHPARAGYQAMVSNAWGRIAYNIVRSLGSKGLRVVVGTDEFLGMAALSRFAATRFCHPSYIRHTPEFIASIKQAFETYSPQVFIPCEQDVLAVAKYRDQLAGTGTNIPIASFDVLSRLHKKHTAQELAKSLGLPTPETIIPRNLDDILQFAREFGDPVVIKRLSSSAARGVSFESRDSLEAANGSSPFRSLQFGEFLVQRYVRGTGYGVSMLFNHGELRAKFTHRRLREQKLTGGTSTLRISDSQPLLEEYAESMLRSVRFHGVAMVEFKYDEAARKAWFLEVNPRFWGSLALAIQSGVDFPHLLYLMAVQGDVPPVLEYRKNVKVRWLLGDSFAWLRQRIHAPRSGPSPPERPVAVGYDDFYWNDPLPFAGQFLLSAIKFISTRHNRPEDNDPILERL